MGLIFGVAIGVVLFTLTDDAVWIGLGAGLGFLFGAGFARRRRPQLLPNRPNLDLAAGRGS